ncbi:MAG: hypothetical protein KGI71_06690 [Patescibacteria group bacterium]|nr:hypothetical protein [Patescibacteria group bacterium]
MSNWRDFHNPDHFTFPRHSGIPMGYFNRPSALRPFITGIALALLLVGALELLFRWGLV